MMRLLTSTSITETLIAWLSDLRLCREEQHHADRCARKVLRASLVDENLLKNAIVEFLKETELTLRKKVEEIMAFKADPAS